MDRPRTWRVQRIDLASEPPLRVGGATIDPVSREARFGADTERLQPQNLKVLIALARQKGEVVTRERLIDLCWDGRIVGEDVINHSISVLRTFAAKASGFEIETVPKAGYRLVEANHSQSRELLRALAILTAVIVLLLIGVAYILSSRPAKQGEPPLPTVALLPLSAPANDPATANSAQAIRSALTHMLSESGLPVRMLNAADGQSDLVVVGDVEHSGNGMVVQMRVERVRENAVIFTHRYEASADHLEALPEQVGASVATNLSWTAALMALDQRRPIDPAMTSELLKQMSITVEGGDVLRAYEISRPIADKQPNSAIAQVALAFNTGFAIGELPRSQRLSALMRGRKASEQAIRLAPEFGDVYIPWCLLHSPTYLAECERRLRDAIKSHPNAPFTNFFLGSLLRDVGRTDEALEMARLSISNDPYKPAKLGALMWALEANGRAEEANEVYLRASRWWPNSNYVFASRALGLVYAGDLDAIEKLSQEDPTKLQSTSEVIAAFRAKDGRGVTQACNRHDLRMLGIMLCPLLLADLGQMDEAFAKLSDLYPPVVGRDAAEDERLWLDHPDVLPFGLLSSHAAEGLRRDRRFIDVARRLGLLAYWRSVKLPDFCRGRPEPVCSLIKV